MSVLWILLYLSYLVRVDSNDPQPLLAHDSGPYYDHAARRLLTLTHDNESRWDRVRPRRQLIQNVFCPWQGHIPLQQLARQGASASKR